MAITDDIPGKQYIFQLRDLNKMHSVIEDMKNLEMFEKPVYQENLSLLIDQIKSEIRDVENICFNEGYKTCRFAEVYHKDFTNLKQIVDYRSFGDGLFKNMIRIGLDIEEGTKV